MRFYERYHDLVNPYNVTISRIVSDVFANDFQNPGHMLLPTFPSFRPMDMVGEGCLPSNVHIRERLITPFILGSMSVGLNILIRHSFTDL